MLANLLARDHLHPPSVILLARSVAFLGASRLDKASRARAVRLDELLLHGHLQHLEPSRSPAPRRSPRTRSSVSLSDLPRQSFAGGAPCTSNDHRELRRGLFPRALKTRARAAPPRRARRDAHVFVRGQVRDSHRRRSPTRVRSADQHSHRRSFVRRACPALTVSRPRRASSSPRPTSSRRCLATRPRRATSRRTPSAPAPSPPAAPRASGAPSDHPAGPPRRRAARRRRRPPRDASAPPRGAPRRGDRSFSRAAASRAGAHDANAACNRSSARISWPASVGVARRSRTCSTPKRAHVATARRRASREGARIAGPPRLARWPRARAPPRL